MLCAFLALSAFDRERKSWFLLQGQFIALLFEFSHKSPKCPAEKCVQCYGENNTQQQNNRGDHLSLLSSLCLIPLRSTVLCSMVAVGLSLVPGSRLSGAVPARSGRGGGLSCPKISATPASEITSPG